MVSIFMATRNYIDDRQGYWGPEFADILEVPYKPEFDRIAGMGAYTMLYHIADTFQGGKHRVEILKQFGVEE